MIHEIRREAIGANPLKEIARFLPAGVLAAEQSFNGLKDSFSLGYREHGAFRGHLVLIPVAS